MTTRNIRSWWVAAFAGVLVAAELWVVDVGGSSTGNADSPTFAVTAGTDAGPGSLRDAIFRATSISMRALISVQVPTVHLSTPLPPLANPRGVVLRCKPAPCAIDAGSLRSGAALDVRATDSRLEDLQIVGARGPAVLLSASNVVFQRMHFEGNEIGIYLAQGSHSIVVTDSTFARNVVGLRIDGSVHRTQVRANTFRDHTDAGIWAVAPSQSAGFSGDALVVQENRFEDNRIGALIIHLPSLVEENEISRSHEAGLYLGGGENAIVANRLLGGSTNGIVADDVWASSIARNEVGSNRASGVLIRRGGSNQVEENRIYDNGFGIVVVYGERSEPTVLRDNLVFEQRQDALWVFAGAPIVRGNRLVRNRGAGIRLVDTAPKREDDTSRLMVVNDLERNGVPVAYELYRGTRR